MSIRVRGWVSARWKYIKKIYTKKAGALNRTFLWFEYEVKHKKTNNTKKISHSAKTKNSK